MVTAIYLTHPRQQPAAARPAGPDGPGPRSRWRRRWARFRPRQQAGARMAWRASSGHPPFPADVAGTAW